MKMKKNAYPYKHIINRIIFSLWDGGKATVQVLTAIERFFPRQPAKTGQYTLTFGLSRVLDWIFSSLASSVINFMDSYGCENSSDDFRRINT